MPLAYGDPGLFICSIPDGGEQDVKKPTPAFHISPPPNAWIVLAICRRCNVRTGRYCTDHDPDNWWLTKSGLGFQIRNPRKTPGQTGVPDLEPQTPRKDDPR